MSKNASSNFELVLNEPDVLVPDTGNLTISKIDLGSFSPSLIFSAAMLFAVVVGIIIFIIQSLKSKKNSKLFVRDEKFAIHSKKRLFTGLFLSVALLASGGFFAYSLGLNNGAFAADNSLPSSSLGYLKAEAKAGEFVSVCDTITVEAASIAGYQIFVNLEGDLALDSDASVTIPALRGNGSLSGNTWAATGTANNLSPEGNYWTGIATSAAVNDRPEASEAGDSLQICYGINTTSEQTPGTYRAKINYEVMPTAWNFVLSFNMNGTNVETEISPINSGSTKEDNFVMHIPTTIPIRDGGYIFRGWNTRSNGTGETYQPGDMITLTSTTVSLFAMWESSLGLTPKAILGANGNLSFVYDAEEYAEGAPFNDNLGTTTISAVYAVPAAPESAADIPWQDSNSVLSANFTPDFYSFRPTSTAYWFYGAHNFGGLTNVANLNTSAVTNMGYMFASAGDNVANLNLDLRDLNVGSVEDMSLMFNAMGIKAQSFSIDMTGWDTSNVKNMAGMFTGAGLQTSSKWELKGISNWNVGQVENMLGMFMLAAGWGNLSIDMDLSSWDVSKVTTFASMFNHFGSASNHLNLNLSGWNLTSSETISAMFVSLGNKDVTLTVDNWDTSKIKIAEETFGGIAKGTEGMTLDLSSWDTSSFEDTHSMFSYSASDNHSLETIYVSEKWDMSKVTNSTNMFENATALISNKGFPYNNNYKDAHYAKIDDGTSVGAGYLSNKTDPKLSVEAKAVVADNGSFKTLHLLYDRVDYRSGAPYEIFGKFANAIEVYNIPNIISSPAEIPWKEELDEISYLIIEAGFDQYTPVSTAYWFYGLENAGDIVFNGNINYTLVENISHMFEKFGSKANNDVWYLMITALGDNTSAVKNMSALFKDSCNSACSVSDIYLASESVEDMSSMFDGINANSFLLDPEYGGNFELNTENVTNMSHMFANINGQFAPGEVDPSDAPFVAIDLTGFDTSKVTNMSEMFKDTKNLYYFPKGISNWNVENVTDMSGMFSGITQDVLGESFEADLTGWNTSSVTDMTEMFNGVSALTKVSVGDGWNTDNVTASDNMLTGLTSIVGGSGTVYDATNPTDKTYARADKVDTPGYFTDPEYTAPVPPLGVRHESAKVEPTTEKMLIVFLGTMIVLLGIVTTVYHHQEKRR